MKKFLLSFCLMLLPLAVSAYDALINGVFYDFDSQNMTATVTCEGPVIWHIDQFVYGNSTSSGDIVIPSEINYKNATYKVTNISAIAFRGCSGLTSITIPYSVTSIGHSAFKDCDNLTSVTIPNSINSIENSTFGNCGKLSTINIPDGVKTIGNDAFYGCSSLTSITIPASVSTIGIGAFRGCSNLLSVAIPNGVTTIGGGAFWDCSSLTSVTIPDNLTTISGNLFHGCINLSAITIPGNVTTIGPSSFEGCSGLTSITIPEGVTTIDDYAFWDCSSLATISVPESVTSIGCDPFGGTLWFENLECQPDGMIYIGQFAYKYKGTMPVNTSIVLREGTTAICGDAFYDCNGLTSISIPYGVTSVGPAAFMKTSLKTVTIPSSVTQIGNKAFSNISNLTSVTIEIEEPLNLDKWKNPFSQQKCLYVPKGCLDAYKEAVIWKSFKEIKEFIKFGTLTYIIEEDNSVSVKDTSEPNANEISIPESITVDGVTYPVKAIAGDAFVGINSLCKVNIPKSVLEIGANAFSGCSSLNFITIPESVTEIGADAFSNCSSLASIDIPESITRVGDGIFSGTPWYDNLPDGVVYFGKVAYTYKGEMPYNTNIEIKAGTKEIYQSFLLWRGGNLASVTFPISLETIGDNAFCGCNLTSVTIPDGVISIGKYAFLGCHLTSVSIPKSVKSIGVQAFGGEDLSSIMVESGNTTFDSRDNCNAIIETATNTLVLGCKNTIIPNSIVDIGEHSFHDSSLIFATIPSGVSSIGDCTFYSCQLLKKVFIPSTVTSIGDYAFSNCQNIESVKVDMKEPLTNRYRASFFNDNYNNPIILYVPKGCSEAYANASQWKGHWSEIKEFVNDDVASYTIEEGKGASVIDTSEPTVNDVEIPASILVEDKACPVTAIAANAFVGNTTIEKVSIPESIEEIGSAAFMGCSYLNTIYCYAEEPIALGHDVAAARSRADGEESAPNVFDGVDKVTCLLYVPAGCVGKYKAAEGWNDFKYIEEIGSKFIIGNVNGDDVLDEKDLNAVVNHIMSKPQEGEFDEGMADVNKDDEVNAADIVEIGKMMKRQ